MQISFWNRCGSAAVARGALRREMSQLRTGHYAKEIEKAIIIAVLMPLIISSGGNSGSQATSLIIRAMALNEITLRDWWRVASRELTGGSDAWPVLGAARVYPDRHLAASRITRLWPWALVGIMIWYR